MIRKKAGFFASLSLLATLTNGSPAMTQKADFTLDKSTPAPEVMTLWRHGNWRLTLPRSTALSLAGDPKTGLHAMVRYAPGSPLEKRLANSSRTLLMQPLDDPQQAVALVQADNLSQLDPLAQMAHAEDGFACGRMEVLDLASSFAETVVPLPPAYSTTVVLPEIEQLLTRPKGDNIMATIEDLEAMGTRHHATTRGRSAPETIRQLFETTGTGITDLQASLFTHQQTSQKSVIVTIPGTEDNNTAVVVGAHLDSINYDNVENAPGADDDASGVGTMLEVVRVLKESGARFKRRIEFHAYAAEEVGLVGSADIAKSYQSVGRAIAGMMQLDMTAYTANNASTIYLAENDTSTELRRAVKNLMQGYLGGDYVEATLKAGTSDHRSWHRNGFAAVFPFEHPENYNHLIHTAQDKATALTSTALVQRFAQLTLAYLSHYAGLEAASGSYDQAQGTASGTLSTDLKVAVVPSTEGGLVLLVAAPTSVTQVEICTITARTDADCPSERLRLSLNSSRGSRHVFWKVDALPQPTSGQNWRLMGYDSNDKLISSRNITLK